MKSLKVSIIGQGYVGLPIAMGAAGVGHDVVGFDLDQEKVHSLNSGISHIEDISNINLQTLLLKGKYRATCDTKDLNGSDVVVIAVPTPLSEDRQPDLSYIKSASKIIGENLKTSALIVNESTSYPGTLRNLIKPIVEKNSPEGLNHEYAISPERVDPGNPEWNLANTPRLLSGISPEAMTKATEFYSSFCDVIIATPDPESAEMAKLFENTFRQVNIALVNELAQICRGLGISVNEVINAANTKPYGFMGFRPGIGVGGHCIPVDPTYLAFSAKEIGIEAKFINLANEVNLEMPKRILARILKENGNSVRGKSVLICGIAYKPNVGDVRESPALLLREALISEGAQVSWHDPLVSELNGEVSEDIKGRKFGISIVTVLHDSMSIEDILATSDYIFDCTGKIAKAIQL